MLIGNGEDEAKIRKKIKELHLEDSVSLLIDRADVNELYQVMDIFVMPSLFEGVPVVGVEAQANGLPCIFSDKISKEIILTNNIKMLSLQSTIDDWANCILDTDIERNSMALNQLKEKGYNVIDEAKNLLIFYESLEQRC